MLYGCPKNGRLVAVQDQAGFDATHDSVKSLWVGVPDGTRAGATEVEGVWTNPPPPPAVLSYVDDVPTFLMRFSGPERVAIRASTDELVVDFMTLLNDPRTVAVNRALESVQQGVGYLEQINLIPEGRAAQILAPDAV